MSAPRLFRRAYRMRALPALLLCLPALLLVFIYVWRGYARLDSFRRSSGAEVELGLDSLQIAVFDVLERDLRRMRAPPPPDKSPLESFEFQVKRDDWERLERSAKIDEDRPYFKAKLLREKRKLDVEMRLRGHRYWHTSLSQKSLKIKLDKGYLLNGHRVFNLLNDPTPMVVGEHLILELASDLDVLTPDSGFARVSVNHKDLGVYLFETEPDESLLRNRKRVPGSIFSANLPARAETESLWKGTEHWDKVVSRTDKKGDETDFSELSRLLERTQNASFEEFAEFAKRSIDLERFAALDVLDVAFGGNQHDFRENHSYYFDPNRGRWEPVAWNFRGFQSDPKFNLVENPLLIRLKMLPEYLSLRDRELYRFLTGQGSPSAVRERGIRILRELMPDLESDPHWDAYRLLPRVSRFHRRLVRPMNLRRAVLVFDSEFATYRRRHMQLMLELEKNPLLARLGTPRLRESLQHAEPPRAAPPSMHPNALGTAATKSSDAPAAVALSYETPLDVVIDGRTGVSLQGARVEFEEGCSAPESRFTADGHDLGESLPGSYLELKRPLALYPSVMLVPQENPNAERGPVRTELVPVRYALVLESNCRPTSVTWEATHLATEAVIRSRPVTSEVETRLPREWPGPELQPRLVAGQLGPHPWQLRAPKTESVRLGPGTVEISETTIYAPHQSVTVSPGTKLLLSEGASLMFFGHVDLVGTREAPILVQGQSQAPWGGIVIQGAESSGSSLSYVAMSGGSTPRWGQHQFAGMLTVQDNRDVSLRHCRFEGNAGKGDMIHTTYSKAFVMDDVEVLGAALDAIDLEFTDAALRRLTVVNPGDDGLDLMGADVRVQDSVVLGAGGNGVSSGEESQVSIRNTLVADSQVGVLAKNASAVTLLGSVLFRNAIGVRVYTRTVRYDGDSHVRASVVYVVDSKELPIQREERKTHTLDQGRVLQNWPERGIMDNFLHNVVELDRWKDLPAWIETKRREAVR